MKGAELSGAGLRGSVCVINHLTSVIPFKACEPESAGSAAQDCSIAWAATPARLSALDGSCEPVVGAPRG